jgi:hypothetical protein
MTHEGLIVKTTNGIAVGGLTLNTWLPSLADVSSIAALLVPVFSLVWLAIQITRTIKNWGKDNDDKS